LVKLVSGQQVEDVKFLFKFRKRSLCDGTAKKSLVSTATRVASDVQSKQRPD
jgi:hypothetical protein